MELRCPNCFEYKQVGAAYCPKCTHRSSLKDEVVVELGGIAFTVVAIILFFLWISG
tara:strand:- start:219 stop:386 length:168 start_codon:yes stop_codon:yes gene_type:complete